MAAPHQLALWQREESPVERTHHLIELVYRDGKRRIVDTSNPDDKEAFSDMAVWSAEFVPEVKDAQ